MRVQAIGARLAWLLLPLLAGCGHGFVGNNQPPAPPDCQREADQDPAVKELMMKMSATQYWRGNGQNDLVVARRDALLRCMRANGLISRGGVEVVRPVWYDFP